MQKNPFGKYFKTLLTTSCLTLGIANSINAATVSPAAGTTARFSSNTNWVQYLLPPPVPPINPNASAPANNDSIAFFDGNSTVVADVPGRVINSIMTSIIIPPGTINVEQPFKVTNGVYALNLAPIPIHMVSDNKSLEVDVTNLLPIPPQLYRFNIDFNSSAVNSSLIIDGSINPLNFIVNASAVTPTTPAGIIDFAGTPLGTNMTFGGNITNVNKINIRANNIVTFNTSPTIGDSVTINSVATAQLALGQSISAARIIGPGGLNLVGNNVVNAPIGQNGDTPISSLNLQLGTGTLNQSTTIQPNSDIPGNITLSPLANLILALGKNLTAANIVGNSTSTLTLNGNNVVDVGMTDPSLVGNINLVSGTGEFKKSINVANNVTISGNGANLILNLGVNLTAQNIVGNAGNNTLTLRGNNIVDAKSGVTTLALGNITIGISAAATLKQSMTIANNLNLNDGASLTINGNFKAANVMGTTAPTSSLILLQGNNVVFDAPVLNPGFAPGGLSVLSGTGQIKQNLTVANNVALGANATLILDKNLTAARIVGDNTNNVILSGDNVVAATVGQANIPALNNISLLAGKGTLTKATAINGDFVLSPNTTLQLGGAANNQNYVAKGISGNNTNNLILDSFTILDTQIGSGAPYSPLNNITLLGSGYGSFVKPVIITGDAILPQGAALVANANFTANRILGTSGLPLFNGGLQTNGANTIIDALIGQNGDAPLTGMQLFSGKTTLVKSASFVQAVTLSANTELVLGTGVTLKAGNITAAGSSVLTLNKNNTIDAVISSGTNPAPINTINVLAGNNEFKQAVNIAGNVVLSKDVTLIFDSNFKSAKITGDNTNTLTLNGQSIVVDASIGQGADTPLGSVNINAASAEFKQGVNIAGDFTLAANTAVKFDAAVKGNNILSSAGNTAVVEFANTTQIQPNVTIGTNAAPINTLRLSGTDIEFTKDTNINNIEFTSSNPTTATFSNNLADLGGANVTTNSTARIHNINVAVDQNITGNFGSSTNQFGAIKTTNDNTININTANFYSDVTTSTNNTGTVVFVLPGSFSYDLGDSTNELAEIIFSASAEVRGKAYAHKVTVNGNSIAGFKSRQQGDSTIGPFVQTVDGINLVGSGGGVVFGNGATVKSSVFTTVNNTGSALFEGDANMTGDLGTVANGLSLITFNGNDEVDGNAYAGQIIVGPNSKVSFGQGVDPTVQTTNGIELQGGSAEVEFGGNAQVNTKITTIANNTGTVSFGNNPTITGDLGDAANFLALVKFNGNALVDQSIYSQDVSIAASSEVTFDSPVVQITNGIGLNGTGSKVIFGDNAQINAKIFTTVNNTGTVSFGNNDTLNNSVGDANNQLALVIFNGDANVAQNIYSQEINIAAGHIVNFNSQTVQTTNGVVLQGAGADVIFGDNAVVNGPILTTVTNTGTVTFGNNPAINGSLGNATNFLQLVQFNGDATLMQSAYSEQINIAAGHTVNFNSPTVVTTVSILLQGADATAVFGDNATISSPIYTLANNTGKAIFGNNPTINGKLGDVTNSLELVQFNGDATVEEDINAQQIKIAGTHAVIFNSPVINTPTNIELGGSGASAVFTGDNAQLNSGVVSTGNNTDRVSFVGNNINVNGTLGSANNRLLLTEFKGNTTVNQIHSQKATIAPTHTATFSSNEIDVTDSIVLEGEGSTAIFTAGNTNVSAPIVSLVNNAGVAQFNGNENTINNIGSAQNRLNLIQINGNSNFSQVPYTQKIAIGEEATANFSQQLVPADNTELQGTNATANFVNNADLKGSITALTNNTGNIRFADNIDIKVPIGTFNNRLNEVNFAADTSMNSGANNLTTINLNEDIHAANIIINSAIINLQTNRTLDGSTNMVASSKPLTINFGQNTLKFTGGNSSATGNAIFNVYYDGTNNSYIQLDQQPSVPVEISLNPQAFALPSTLDLSELVTLFQIDDHSGAQPQGTVTMYYVLQPNDLTGITVMPNNLVTISSNNNFATWTYANGVLIQTSNVSGGIGGVVDNGNTGNVPISGNTQDTLNLFTDPRLSGAALALLQEVANLSQSGNDPAALQALLSVALAVNPTAEGVVNIIDEVNDANRFRIDNVVFTDLLNYPISASAGDEVKEDYAVWFQPFYSNSHQKRRADQPAFRTRATGMTIGIDTSINDKSLIGISFSIVDSKIRYKGYKSGDKSKIDTLMLSLYGMHEIHNDWFAQTVLSIGTNKVKNSKPRLNQVARGHYRSTSYNAEVAGGYRWLVASNTILTPTLGARYSRFDSDNYNESATTNANLRIKKKAYNKLDLVFGGRLNNSMQYNDYILTPQLHAFVNYDLFNKAARASVNLDGLSTPFIPLKIKKPVRVFCNTGAALALTKGPMEYEISYDFRFGQNFKGHQGALKLRVKF